MSAFIYPELSHLTYFSAPNRTKVKKKLEFESLPYWSQVYFL